MRILRYIPEILLLPFIIKRVGDEAYGIYVLAWSVIIALKRIEGPITSAVIKFNASYMAKRKGKEINQLISTAYIISLFLALIVSIGIIIIIFCFPEMLKISNENPIDIYMTAFFIISITILIAFPMMPYVGVMYSLQRHDLFYMVDTLSSYVKAIAIVIWFLIWGPSLTLLIAICGAAFIITRLVMVIIANKSIPEMENRIKNCNWSTFQMIFSFAGILLLSSVCYIINFTGLKWTMGIIVSAAFVAYLEIILMPSRIISQIVNAMTSTIMPVASKYSALENREKLVELFIRGTRYIILILWPIIIVSFLMMEPLVNLWLGEKYVFLTKYILVLICFRAAQIIAQCAYQMLKGIGEVKLVLLCSIISQAVLPLGTTIIAFVFSGDPYLAVTIGLSTGFTGYMLLYMYYSRKIFEVPYQDLLKKVYVEPLIVGIPIILLAKFAVVYWNITNLTLLIIVSTFTLAVFGILFLIFFATEQEKELIKNMGNLLSNNKPIKTMLVKKRQKYV